MSILSYNPQISYNIFKDGSYLYNGSISPTFYENLDCYTWDETYDPHFYHYLRNNMERKNGIQKGVVLTKQEGDLKILFSFATKSNGEEFLSSIKENKEFYLEAGDNCFKQIKPILDLYLFDEVKKPIKSTSNILRFP